MRGSTRAFGAAYSDWGIKLSSPIPETCQEGAVCTLLCLKAPLLIGCHDVPEHHASLGTALHGCSAVSGCYQRSEASPDHLSLQACSLAKHRQNHLNSVAARSTLTPLGDMG